MLNRALAGDDWSLEAHLLAIIVDKLAQANWQRQGKRGAKRPEPISPLARRNQRQRVGNTSDRSPEEVKAVLHGYRTGAFDRG